MTYSANDLQTLEGLDAVRKRPGMYIGSTDDAGRSHLVYEIVDNSVDEALAGHCTRIDVTLDADGYCTVADNGRGIPVDVNTKTGLSGVEMAIGSLHSGGKFGGSGYRSAGGLHGVGAAVTNALSERLDVEVKRDGKVHTLSYQRGVSGVFKDGKFAPKKGLRVEGKCDKGDTGTTVRFKPDDAIFMPDSKFDVDAIRERLRRTAFLVPAVTIVFHHGGQVEEFHFDGGISDLAEALSDGTRIGDVINITGTGTFVETVPMLTADGNMEMTDVEREVEVSVAIVATTGYEPLTQSFCNIVHTSAGGSHEKGYEQGILKWARENVNAKAKDPQIVIADVLEGLTTVVMVGFPEPQFTSQDKRCLGSKQVQPIVADVVYNGLTAWAKQRGNGVNAKTILEKILTAARVRVATKEERDTKRRKTALENGNNLPAKLVDCRSRDNSELILIEGDSAAGSVRGGRNSDYQAYLPLRGKILNTWKATPSAILGNAEVAAIIQCLGAGSGRTFNTDDMRYDRVILLMDADVDGAHIRTLIITMFAKLMPALISEGRLYAAVPPLYHIVTVGKDKQERFAYSDSERDAIIAEFEKSGKQVKTPIQRFKGLGEMDANELKVTTLDPTVRKLRRITMRDAGLATERFELLMGNEVGPRKDFIMNNARITEGE